MHSPVAVISLKNIVRNAKLAMRAAKKPIIAVVKDDAYGHGAEAVARALAPYVAAFAVATTEEGAALRTAGVSKDILVLTPPLDGEDVVRTAAYDLIASISSLAALRLVARTGVRLRAHLAVNTGMNRYGVRPERAGALAREAGEAGIRVEGVYSHLYCPDDWAAAEQQKKLFLRAVRDVKRVFPDAVRHLSSTGGMLEGDSFDLVRVGIALYGYLPQGFEGKLGVKPAMKLYASVSQSGTFIGGGVGYAGTEKRYSKLHTLRLGYGDGFFREGGLGAIGKLCMDACVRQGGARFGKRRLVLADVTAYAKEHGTTEYEVLVNIARKAERIYL